MRSSPLGSMHLGAYPDSSFLFILYKAVVQASTPFPEIVKNITQSVHRIFLTMITGPDTGT